MNADQVPTLPLPCDRCGLIEPLWPRGHELLCLDCIAVPHRRRRVA